MGNGTAEHHTGHDTRKTARNFASQHETTQQSLHWGHDAGKTARNFASRHGTTQQNTLPRHDAGKTPRNYASRQGTTQQSHNWGHDAGKTERNSASRLRNGTAEELELMMTTPLHNARLYIVRDLFLFSCYTGISYGDMCMLTKEDLVTDENGTLWIRTSRKKTKVEYEVPLLDVPLHILNKYRDVEPNGKLLPMYCNSDVNLSLKKIAAICGIERRIVFHAARHTYATEITLSHGVPLETVSKMLGHTRVDTTQIYAKVTDEKIDADTKRLDSKISERFTIAI